MRDKDSPASASEALKSQAYVTMPSFFLFLFLVVLFCFTVSSEIDLRYLSLQGKYLINRVISQAQFEFVFPFICTCGVHTCVYACSLGERNTYSEG